MNELTVFIICGFIISGSSILIIILNKMGVI
jgi:hypothetical protein